MNSNKSLSQADKIKEETSNTKKQKDTTKESLGKLVASIAISSSVLLAGEVQAKTILTDEELAKARQVASAMKPAVNLDELLAEADRLGITCDGVPLTLRAGIRRCSYRVEAAQSQEETARLKEENARLDEENARLDEETAQIREETAQLRKENDAKREKLKSILSETKQIADKKLDK